MKQSGYQGFSLALAGLALVFCSLSVMSRQADGFQPTDPPATGDTAVQEDEFPDTAVIRKLNKKEISRIRYMELRGMRLSAADQPDRVIVKIPQATVDEFLTEMQGEPGFSTEAGRREFRKLTPPQKLHVIAKRKGEAFADKVDIQTDPEVFVEFRKQVLPTIFRGCATSGCHSPGNEEQAHFSLYKDPKKSAATTYANFIVLTELRVGDYPLLDREHPENSLLLTYMLPSKDVKAAMRHPGKEEIRAQFQSAAAPTFRRIERWIASLKVPQPDYGVQLLPHPTTTAESKEPDLKPNSSDPSAP